MADLYVRAQQQNVGRGVDGTWLALRATRDGSPIVMPWVQALVLEGRVFSIIGPEAATRTTTGMTLLALASFGDDDETLYADIPDGTAAIPLNVEARVQVSGGAVAHAYAFVTATLLGTGGTETACVIRNLRIDAPVTSGATAAHTADSEVDHVTGTEVFLFRFVTTFDLDAAIGIDPGYTWSYGTNGYAPVALDASALCVSVVQTTSGTGWASLQWAELPESAFT